MAERRTRLTTALCLASRGEAELGALLIAAALETPAAKGLLVPTAVAAAAAREQPAIVDAEAAKAVCQQLSMHMSLHMSIHMQLSMLRPRRWWVHACTCAFKQCCTEQDRRVPQYQQMYIAWQALALLATDHKRAEADTARAELTKVEEEVTRVQRSKDDAQKLQKLEADFGTDQAPPHASPCTALCCAAPHLHCCGSITRCAVPQCVALHGAVLRRTAWQHATPSPAAHRTPHACAGVLLPAREGDNKAAWLA